MGWGHFLGGESCASWNSLTRVGAWLAAGDPRAAWGAPRIHGRVARHGCVGRSGFGLMRARSRVVVSPRGIYYVVAQFRERHLDDSDWFLGAPERGRVHGRLARHQLALLQGCARAPFGVT